MTVWAYNDREGEDWDFPHNTSSKGDYTEKFRGISSYASDACEQLSNVTMSIERTLRKIEQDIDVGDYGKARDRLHGLIFTYPDNLALRRKLGEIYWKLQYPAMAGRYWYLEEEKTPTMMTACENFERSCGNDPLQILLALKFRGDFESIQDTFAGCTLLELHTKARAMHRYYVDFRKPKAQKYYQTTSKELDPILQVGCVVGLLIAFGLMIVGLLTVLARVF